MSGHSKWATTKRHKAAVDAKEERSLVLLVKRLPWLLGMEVRTLNSTLILGL